MSDSISIESPRPPIPPGMAAVLTGGGARAAYQAGVLRGIGRHFPELRFPILTGVSAGAINASYLAAHGQGLGAASEDMCRLWNGIEIEDVFRADLTCLARNSLSWLTRLGLGRKSSRPGQQGLVDTAPLRALLRRELQAGEGPIPGVADNVEKGLLSAVALMTVNYGTGQTVSWIEGRDIETWERPERVAWQTRLTVEHVMASAALPLLFPAVALPGGWYGDGGIRLSAPLSPALHLGADRILAISTRYAPTSEEAGESKIRSYPPPAQIAGNLLNAIFLDVLDQDVLRLERLNGVVRKLPPEEREDLRPIDILLIRPSVDLGKLSAGFEARLPKGFRFLTRNLGTRETESPDALSLLMFQPEYISRLLEVGEKDALAQIDAIERLFYG